jgi:WD40 repeat protein
LTYVAFGSTDDEIIAFSEFGLKVTVFKLSSSTSIDINTPKLFQSGSATKGYSYRPRTSHFALLTRSGGKDIVSIHEKDSYVVLRSWNPDTVDSQALSWSPDGRWLAVVESAGQGHKVLIYTADGHLLKVWNGPSPMSDEEKDIDMGAGLRMFEWSSMSQLFAIGDHSPRITVLSTPSFLASLSLYHTTTIRPVDGLQVRLNII